MSAAVLAPPVVPMGDAAGHVTHFVTDSAAAAGRPSGVYFAWCGKRFTPASLAEPDYPWCERCVVRRGSR